MINTRSDFYLNKIDKCLEFEGYKEEETFTEEEINKHNNDLADIEEARRGQY